MYFYTLLLGIIGIGTGLWGLLFPMGMLDLINWVIEDAGKSLTLEGTGKLFIIQLGSTGDLAIGVLFFMVLFLFRTRETLLSIFFFYLVLSIVDTVVMYANSLIGIGGIIWGLLWMSPILICLYVLLYKIPSKER
jgi:hypothetical protein